MATSGQVREALGIIIKYGGAGELVAAGHDELFAGTTPPEKMAAADALRLEELRFSWVGGVGCWRCFT